MPTKEHDDVRATPFLASNEYARWYKTGIDFSDQTSEFVVQALKHRLFEPAIPDTCLRTLLLS
jgi:hypothetical protein